MKFTIVIPTLNRAEVLPWSVTSVLNQQGNHELKMIISDNCSDDNTRDVVAEFNDKRIKYITPPRRMSMAKHWEFASKYLEVDDGCVMYLGDDDVLSSSAFDIASQIFSEVDVDAIRQVMSYYYTPGCDTPFAGHLYVRKLNGTYEVRNSLEVLRKVASLDMPYTSLPYLYGSFVKSSVIDQLKRRGFLFNKAAPDVYTGISVASLDIQYAFLQYPIALGVSSPKSNGLNCGLNARKQTDIGREYVRISMEELSHSYNLDSVILHILDCLEEVNAYLDDKPIKINYQKYYNQVVKHGDFIGKLNNLINDLKKISGKNSIQIYGDYVTGFLSWSRLKSLIVLQPIKNLVREQLLTPIKNLLRERSLMSNINAQKSFSYYGDITKEGVYDPLGCMAYIERNIQFRGLTRFDSQSRKL